MRNPNLARTLAFRQAQTQTEQYGKSLEAKDGNNCTVVSLQHLTGITYAQAYHAVKALGRQRGTGLWAHISYTTYLDIYRSLGFKVTKTSRLELVGKYLVFTRNHAAAVINGKVINGLKTNQITDIFLIERG